MAKQDEQKPGQQQPETERKFSQEQYDLLKRCSAKKDMTEWNNWRIKHSDEEILLQGAYLKGAHLDNAYLSSAHLENANLQDAHLVNAYLEFAHLDNAFLVEAHLENADLGYSHLENADLSFAHLEHAILEYAHLKNTELICTHLEYAILEDAILENVELAGAHLEYADLEHAHLKNSRLFDAHLVNAKLTEANLCGSRFWIAKLQGSDFSRSIFDGEALFDEKCEVDRDTKFEAVALGNLRIYPNIKQLLEYNIRRMNWEQWYRGKSKNKWIIKMHQLLTCPVRLFWWVSKYGLSTWRIIFTFFALAFVFAMIYWLWPKCVLVNGIVGDIKGFVHALYFSVVTMTTLGFGDIAANPDNWKGQVLLMVQVILGYVLLGALVTRFAVLFTAGGPAGKFAPTKTKVKGDERKD